MPATVKCSCGRGLPRPRPGESVACPSCGKTLSMPLAAPGEAAPRRNVVAWILGLGALFCAAGLATGYFLVVHRPAPARASEPETPEERSALAREAFAAGPRPAQGGDEMDARATVEALVARLRNDDADGFAGSIDVPRLMAEMEAPGRLFRTRIGEQLAAESLVEGLPEYVGSLGWSEAKATMGRLRRDGREADVWARVRCEGELRNMRFRLVREGHRGWRLYDWDDLEEGDGLSSRYRHSHAADREPGGRESYDRSNEAMGALVGQAREEEHDAVLRGVARARRLPPHAELLHEFERLEGNAQLGLGRNEDALAAYDRALADRPDFPVAHHLRGRALNLLERHEEGAEAQREFLRRVGDQAAALHWLGASLEGLSREADAIEAYRRGAAADPEAADLRFALARLLLRGPERLGAVDVLREALAVDASRYGQAAQELRSARAWDELLRLTNAVRVDRPADPEVLLDRGRALRRLGRPEQAIEDLRRGHAAVADPDDGLDHLEELACAAAALGRSREAIESLEKLKEREPDSPRFLYARARFRAALDRAEPALEDLDAVLREEPWRHGEMRHEPLLEPLRDRLAASLDRAKEAQDFIEAASRISGGPDWGKLLALALERLGTAPADTNARYWEGYALRKLGRPAEAERALRSAGEGWGSRWELALALADAGKTDDALRTAALFEAEEERRPGGLYLRLYALARAGSPEAAPVMERLLEDNPSYASWIESEAAFEALRATERGRALLERARSKRDE